VAVATADDNRIRHRCHAATTVRRIKYNKGEEIMKCHTGCGALLRASALALVFYSAVANAAADRGSTPADPAKMSLEDIVVTAQRRSQNQQDVPISITAVTGDIAGRSGVVNTEGLSNLVPSLQFSRQTALGGAPFIRGVGTSAVPPGVETAVATYVDDVYYGSPRSTTMALNNVDHIEVLKGPQGTLFGRNATGGVVSIHSRKPSQDPAYEATFGYGNYNTTDLNLYLNQPLSDTFALNVAAARYKRAKGYGLDINTGERVYTENTKGVRAEALWTPTEQTSMLFIADYSHYNGDTGQNVTVLPGTFSIVGTGFPGKYRATAFPKDVAWTSQHGFSLKIEHDFDFMRLVSVTAQRSDKSFNTLDTDGGIPSYLATTTNIGTRTFQQELRLLSPASSRFQWIGGLIYYRANSGYGPTTNFGSSLVATNGGSNTVVAKQILNSFGAFGEVNFDIFDKTRLTLGGRYTTDKFTLDHNRVNAAGVSLPLLPLHLKDSFSKFTYRAVLDHHFTDDVMAYASYSRGFKSGGFNVQTPTVVVGGVTVVAPPVTPEVLDAYELGTKMEFFDRKLRINPSIYLYKYKNLQVSTIQNTAITILNAAAAEIKGADIDFEALPFRHLKLGGGIAILDSKFTSFPAGPYYVARPGVCTPTPMTTGPLIGGNITCSADLSGNRTTRAPKFTASVNATYSVPTDVGLFELTGSFYHNSGFFWESDNRFAQPSYNLVGATLSWTSTDKRFVASLWGRNLGNVYYYSFVSEGTFKDSGSPALPRTYGATFGVRF
jgi:iron complex outermembrane recepter protein